MTKKLDFDPMTLKGIPNLGPIGQEKLTDNHIQTRWDLLLHSPPELADMTGMTILDAGKMQLFVQRQLQDAKLLEPTRQTAYELYEKRLVLDRLSTGAKEFDELLAMEDEDGKIVGLGYESQSITELYGAFRSGKTQACMTACIMVQQQKKDGGLSDEKRKACVLYIDTENTCKPERIIGIAKARGLVKNAEEAKELLSNIIIEHPQTASHQMIIIENAQAVIKELNIRLIIVDSGTALFRAEYPSLSLMARRQQALNVMIHKLHTIAENNNCVVLFVNQVYQSPDKFGGDVASGGNVVAHGTTYRVHFQKAKKVGGNETWKATMADSPSHGKDEALFTLTEKGIVDITKSKKAEKKPEEE